MLRSKKNGMDLCTGADSGILKGGGGSAPEFLEGPTTYSRQFVFQKKGGGPPPHGSVPGVLIAPFPASEVPNRV